mgnify:CR=1 FL=1
MSQSDFHIKQEGKMTKVQLEALGRQHGIELDRRLHKETLIEQISDAIDK